MTRKRKFYAPSLLALLFLFLFNISAAQADHTLEPPPAPSPGPVSTELEILKVENVGYNWQTVYLQNSYTSAIPICTYVLPSTAAPPTAVRIQNITTNSFEIKTQVPPDGSGVTTSDVYCLVAEEGLHTLEDGTQFEAHTMLSTTTSGNSAGGWDNGEDVSSDVLGSYSAPVVLGQVISSNNNDFSTFWSYDCDNRSNTPFQSGMADGICVGKHVGQINPGSLALTRSPEDLGYIVLEGDPDGLGGPDPAGILLSNGIRYETALGPDSVDGADDSGASYTLSNSGYSIGVATHSAMDGVNGGWAVLYGADPLAGNQIDLAIDEDTLNDSERNHTTENVAYWVFQADLGLSSMESLLLPNVGSAWQTVSLSNDYASLVPVCTYNLPSASDNEALVRIRNINNAADTFQIRLQRPQNSAAVTASDVHCVVVEEGTHTLVDQNPALNRSLEAYLVNADQFNSDADWSSARMENVGYTNSYNQPIVLGQVVTYNDPNFSVFWSSNGTATDPPDAANLFVGKHVAEDPGSVIATDETLGYLIVEGGNGFSNGFFYQAALGPDTVAGVGNSPPYSYSLPRTYAFGVATKEAEDGGDGGWAVMFGLDPLAAAELDLAIEEETAAGDATRTHTDEQIAYWVFDPVLGGTVWEDLDVDGQLESGESGLNGISVWLCPDTHSMPPASPACQTATTDTAGFYYFRAVASGDYYLAVNNPSAGQSSTAGGDHDPAVNDDLDDGMPDPGGYAITQVFSYTVGTGSTSFDFGFADNSDLGGSVWEDLDADGQLENGELGLSAVTVWLCPDTHSMPPASPACVSTITDGSGEYFFRNYASGNYYLAVADPDPGLLSTLGGSHDPTLNDQVDDGQDYPGGGYVFTQDFSYIGGTTLSTIDLGYSEQGGISGNVWEDSNGDGLQNEAAAGIGGVGVELFNAAGVSQGTLSTAANGSYQFSPLLAGEFYLQFTLPSGFLFSPQHRGSDDTLDSDPARATGRTANFTIAAGETDSSRDAGLYPEDAHIFDPPSGQKTVDVDGWPAIVWTHVWINDGNADAVAVQILDPIPADTTFIGGSLNCQARGASVTTLCTFNATEGQIEWEGTIAADPGAQTEIDAVNEVVITFSTTVADEKLWVSNQASAFWDENGNDALDSRDANLSANAPVLSDDPATPDPADPTIANIPPDLLPSTGFPPGQTSLLPAQPQESAYQSAGEMELHIAALGVSLPIVGVPYSNGGWDVTWLANQAGYLEGSAFPTWEGNTVLTAHVWDANNQPGPFAGLKALRYGDWITITAWGQTYTYEIRENRLAAPYDVAAVFRPETYDWITLLTCERWQESSGEYTYRRMVRAVLVAVD